MTHQRVIMQGDYWPTDASQGQTWKKEAPVAHYSCRRWQVREVECLVNRHLLCLCTFNWAFGAGVINTRLQSPWECAGEVWWCVGSVCVWLITHLCPLSELRPFSPFVLTARRREAHLDMRSQIIYLTLRQKGFTERRRVKLKGSDEKKAGNERGRQKKVKQTRA